VELAKSRGLTTVQILRDLGVSKASYYRYLRDPVLRNRTRRKKAPPLTPFEKQAVIELAHRHPLTGYKSLTYLMQNDHIVGVRAHQTYRVLQEESLLGPRTIVGPLTLKKPQSPQGPNLVWHIDLMYVWLSGRWFYLVDILDAYSRYLVHWTLNRTMQTYTVSQTVQEALERWNCIGKAPAMVHDNGTQFLSKDWRDFASHHGMPSIRTRVAHPQSNGLIERVHRTHRSQALAATDEWSYDYAQEAIAAWVDVYNNARPHHSLCGLPPAVYHLGEPDAAMAQREHFVQAAAQARANYWRHKETSIT